MPRSLPTGIPLTFRQSTNKQESLTTPARPSCTKEAWPRNLLTGQAIPTLGQLVNLCLIISHDTVEIIAQEAAHDS